MIKFNQIVRASVLSLTLVGGLGLASHAFAYDQDDIDDATGEYYERLEIVSVLQSQVAADQGYVDFDNQAILDDNGRYSQIWSDYLGDVIACTHGLFPDMIAECADNAYNLYLERKSDTDAQLQLDYENQYSDNMQLASDQAQLADAQELLANAVAWLNTVTNDQNGMHGQA